MSDAEQIDATPQLGPLEHRPHALRSTERESFREVVAEVAHDMMWANRLRAVLDDSDHWIEEAARRGLEAKAAGAFIESQAVLAEQHNAERDAKIAELEKRIAEHTCQGPTTMNFVGSPAQTEFEAELRRELTESRNVELLHKGTITTQSSLIDELRRELAEERSHVRQHKVTIESQGRSIESLREQIYQAQQDAAKSVAPGAAEWQRQVTAKFYKARTVLHDWAEQARKSPDKSITLIGSVFESLILDLMTPEQPGGEASEIPAPDCEQLKTDFRIARDSVAERLGRVKELLQTGPYDQVGREIEEALKELDGVPS